MSVDLLLINPPTLVLHKPDFLTSGTVFEYTVENINPGILSIATYLDYKGFKVKIIDLSVEKKFDQLEEYLRCNHPKAIGVSMTCSYDYLESLQCFNIAKALSPNSFLVAGGQHGGAIGKAIFEDCPFIDLAVLYEGETVLEKALDVLDGKGNFYDLRGIIYNDREKGRLFENYDMPELVDLNEMPVPNFELYPNYLYFTPFVEESRGCPKRCNYCVNSFYKKRPYRYKSAEKFIKDLDHTINLFGNKPFYAVLSANFGVNPKNTIELLKQLKDRNICYGTELSVENPWEEYIDLLYDSGLRLMGIGIESASKEILKRMNKTRNPENYLSRATDLIISASKHGLNPTVNIMCYIGENIDTISETLRFLIGLDRYIYRVAAYSVFEFQGTEVSRNFEEYVDKYGCSRVITEYTSRTHTYPLNVSSDIDFTMATNYCSLINYLFSDDRVRKLGNKSFNYRELDFLNS